MNADNTTTPKGWGYERTLHNGQYCAKMLVLMPNCKTSLHYHLKKPETFFVVSGSVELDTIDTSTATGSCRRMEPGEWCNITVGHPHRLRNIGTSEAVVLEASAHDDWRDNYRIEPGDSQKPTTK